MFRPHGAAIYQAYESENVCAAETCSCLGFAAVSVVYRRIKALLLVTQTQRGCHILRLLPRCVLRTECIFMNFVSYDNVNSQLGATIIILLFNTHCFSIATMVARTRLHVTLYVHCLSCLI